jgi:hypothetical protein
MSSQQLPVGRLGPRSGRLIPRRRSAFRSVAVSGCVLIAALAIVVTPVEATATPTSMVDLGTASTYAVLSGASVGNTVSAVGAPHTTLRGNLGVKANSDPTGFPPGVVTGTKHVGDDAAAKAHADVVSAYDEVASRPGGDPLAGDLIGVTLTPGLYQNLGAVANTGTVTLDGQNNANAVFVFKVGGALSMAAASHVVLIHGAQASRVFWQVAGAGAIGAGASFAGTLLALDAVAVGHGTVFNGRAFARSGALTLDDNEFYSSPPALTIDPGATRSTPDSTPTISGTTDLEAPALVSVTIAGQTLTTAPSNQAWSLTWPLLANDDYTVVASVTDGAGNVASFTQTMTVDTVPPVITLDGGEIVSTRNSTPTIGGTSDAAAGTIITVSVGSQMLTAMVQQSAAWNIAPGALADGVFTVTASVHDLAGNLGSDSQTLTVDTIAPAVTIGGGADALTSDATPQISGTAAVLPGTSVTITLADETLTATVGAGGSWSVTAAALAEGPHRVIMSVSDAAGNPSSLVQLLTVDTVPPGIAITGGATAITNDANPTVTGTSDAAPGTTVTVSIAGQTMTTLLQSNGTWNATPTVLAEGTWAVIASASDPAGNVGSAGQSLTIAAGAAPFADGAGGQTVFGGSAQTVAPAVPASPSTPLAPARDGSFNAVVGTTVAGDGAHRVRGSSLSIGTKVAAPVGGSVAAIANGLVRIKGVKKPIRLSTAASGVAAGASTILRLWPRGSKRTARAAFTAIRAAVRRGARVTATITVRLTDPAGNARVVRRTVELRR